MQDPMRVIEGSKEFGPNMYLLIVVFVGVALLLYFILSWWKSRDTREQDRMDRMVTLAETQGRALVSLADSYDGLDDEIKQRRRTRRRTPAKTKEK